MCYSSHLLEHLSGPDAAAFLREQRRVLRANGLIRIAVPDLGALCRNFACFEAQVLGGDEKATFQLEYTYLELFDQVTRTVPGGDLYVSWLTCPPEQDSFVSGRAGDEYRVTSAGHRGQNSRLSALFRAGGGGRTWRMFRERVVGVIAGLLLGKQATKAVREGLFRASGEIHRVMYDQARLARRLVAAGFRDPKRMTAATSRLPGFAFFNLDAENGRVRKPDSLFIEAVA